MKINDIADDYSLDENERQIFFDYTRNRFSGVKECDTFDESFLMFWEDVIKYAKDFGVAKAINDRVCPKRPVNFNVPEGISIELFDADCGRIPIISVEDTLDFERLVTNVAHKGTRPDNISQIGASFLFGKTTRFIILSSKPYSNVTAGELGLSDEKEWRKNSVTLRKWHECTHYVTKQVYGISNNILHDELMADFIGIYETFGFYRAEWFLRFMGVIEGNGGRIVVYTKDLPENVQRAVTCLMKLSAEGLENWSKTDSFAGMTRIERIKHMCQTGIMFMQI